ncbi:C6 zinc finger domain-containing protein [Apiospora kogelbergensis]|uniref:C6 zinc finger domain-containing protein n=1 Tax=Apiospora kogelbergensis TaxID=1337665 RepID=UPI00312EBE93
MKVDPRAEAPSPSSSPEPPLPNVYSSLLLHGHGFYAHARRQATAALFLDLISELEEQAFPTLQAGTRQRLRELLRNVVHVFRRRVICAGGSHSTREFVLFSAAAAYVDGLVARERTGIGGLHGVGVGAVAGVGIRGGGLPFGDKVERDDVDRDVASAVATALTFCAEVVDQRSLSTSSSSAQSVNLSPTGH